MFSLGQPLPAYAEIYKIPIKLRFGINEWRAFCCSQDTLTQVFFRLLFPLSLAQR